MKNNKLFEKFKTKLICEAALKSALVGLSAGLIAGGLISLICWLCGYKAGLYVAIGVGAGIAILTAIICYFAAFRPTEKEIARRIDALGLAERTITMLDYEGDESYLATVQREDAVERVKKANVKKMNIAVPKWLTGLISGAAVFGITFTLVVGLFGSDILDSPTSPVDPLENFYEVIYIAEDGGEIDGEEAQLCQLGENATSVTAVAMDGYMFDGWSDGNKNPGRTDLNITDDFEVTAYFIAIDGGDGAEDGDVEGPGNGDEASDQPADGESQGGEGNEGDGSGNKGDNEGTGSGEEEGEGKGDGQGEGAGGKFSESNQIVNGEIFYRDWLDQYYQEAMDRLANDEEIPDELREFIEAYYKGI